MRSPIQVRWTPDEPQLPFRVVNASTQMLYGKFRTRNAAKHVAAVIGRREAYAMLWETYHAKPRTPITKG